MGDQEQILVVNAYGDVVEGATASYRDERSVRVTAPGHIDRIVFITRRTKRIMLVIDPKTAKGPGLEEACELNLDHASDVAYVMGGPLNIWLLTMPVSRSQDRCYYKVKQDTDALKMANYLDRTDAWRSVSGRMHKAHEDGFELVGSWKTNRKAPDLQVTLWRQEVFLMVNTEGYAKPMSKYNEYVAELDIDLRSGKGHIFEVAKNVVTRGSTDARLVNQALAWKWGVISFRLEAGGNP